METEVATGVETEVATAGGTDVATDVETESDWGTSGLLKAIQPTSATADSEAAADNA